MTRLCHSPQLVWSALLIRGLERLPPGQVSMAAKRHNRPDAERRLRQASRLARILMLLELIQGRGRYAVRDIAAELECSERTVFRDLAVLELAGVPYFHDRDGRCLRVRPGFQFPAVNLTDDELIGQATATAVMSSPGLDVNDGAGPATRKLRAAMKEDSARLLAEVERVTSVLDLKLADHSRHREAIRAVQWSLVRCRRLSGTYVSPYQSRPKRFELHPYRLCLVRQAWYLIARPEGSDQPRTYRIARFKTLRMTDSPALIPDDFELQGYFGNAWGVYRGDRTFDVEIRFSPKISTIVTETHWHQTQTVRHEKDGGVTLLFRVDGLHELAYWVLGWSGRAKVVRPTELRDLVLAHLRQAIELYQSEANPEW